MVNYNFLLLGTDKNVFDSLTPFLLKLSDEMRGGFSCDKMLVADSIQIGNYDLESYNGVILIITSDSLHSQVFNRIVQQAVWQLHKSDAFFIIPWIKGMSVEDLKKHSQKGNDIAATLLENVHISEKQTSCTHVAEVLRKCCENAYGLYISTMYREISRKFTVLLGYISVTTLFLTAIFIFIAAFFKDKKIQGPPFIETWVEYVPADVMTCIILSILTAFTIYFWQLLQLKLCGSRFESFYPKMKLEFQPVFFLSFSGVFLLYQSKFTLDWKSICIGIGFGILVMSLFRAGCRAKMGPFTFEDMPKVLQEKTLLRQLYVRMAKVIAHTGKPFLQPKHNRVFVSYSASSKWCADTAERLVDILQKKGSHVFFDRRGLVPGQSWKAQLQKALNRVNVFIIVLDEVACQRKWVISEFSYAYLNKMLIRAPEMFIIHPPQMDFSKLDRLHPNTWFFSEIIVRPGENIPNWMKMKMAAFEEKTADAMCEKIRHWGGFENRLDFLVFILKSIIIVPLEMLLAVSSSFGALFLLLPFFVVETGGSRVSANATCTTYPQFALIAAWWCAHETGFSIAMSLSYWFGEKTNSQKGYNIRSRGLSYYLSALGFGFATWFCSQLFGWQDYAVLVLVAYLGFAIGGIAAKEYETFDDADPRTL